VSGDTMAVHMAQLDLLSLMSFSPIMYGMYAISRWSHVWREIWCKPWTIQLQKVFWTDWGVMNL